MTKKDPDEFTCSKCNVKFRGLDSFHGEFRIRTSGIKNIQLCIKCLYETISSWAGEFIKLRAQIEREKEYCIRQHKIDRHADAKRTVYEKVLDLIDSSIMFNGYNERSGYGRDLSTIELEARRIMHGEFKINFEEQIRLASRHLVDGVIPIEKNYIVLEFDGAYWHSKEEDKERDRKKDSDMTRYGYKVIRIPQKIIENDKSRFMTLLLNALYNVKHSNMKKEAPQLPVAPAST